MADQTRHPITLDPTRLRLWPGLTAAGLLIFARFVIPLFAPGFFMYGLICAVVLVVGILIWWLFASRAPLAERVAAVPVALLVLFSLKPLLHDSVATGMMGLMYFIYAVPTLSIGLVMWALVVQRQSGWMRWVSLVVACALGCGLWLVLRTDGIRGADGADWAWRWSATAEEQLADKPEANQSAPVMALPAVPAEWPGFRGPDRNAHVVGPQGETDWKVAPPVELWRRPIGPAWSSFAVHDDLIFTQEQRDETERVSCYRLSDGAPVWSHNDLARFWESNGGAGPRGTPAVSDGRVFALGGTGLLNALDEKDGRLLWARNPAVELKVNTPGWGFSGSPWVHQGLVLVPVAGTLVAYDAATGEQRWVGPTDQGGYGSPQMMTLGGVTQIVMRSAKHLSGVGLDGSILWQEPWAGSGILQPAQTSADSLVIGDSSGTQHLGLAQTNGQWKVTSHWTSSQFKPYFSDYVVHGDHLYGFDGPILACARVADGTRVWKGGRYGQGQLVLLAEKNLLCVLTEKGDLAMVSATPEGFKELARIPALKGKTWNHPVWVKDKLLVRNGTEMVAFQMAAAKI